MKQMIQKKRMESILYLMIAYFLASTSNSSFAQPTIQWQKVFGGSNYDQGRVVRNAFNEGYFLGGATASTNGDVFGNHGGSDFWILKLSESGMVKWKKLFGGSQNDILGDIQPLPDGGCVAVGWTASNDFDVAGQHGETDGWIIRLNEQGNLLWQKTIGGSLKDYFTSVAPTPDNGFIISGYSNSNDGDVSWNNGDIDFWVVKVDSSGGVQWGRSLGGTHQELARSVIVCNDGGYIAAGETFSTDGDITSHFGSNDFWVVKLTESGEMEWQQTFGGEGGESVKDLKQTPDGGYLVIGQTGSYMSGQVSGHSELGIGDYWVIKIGATGDLQWQRPLGGTATDWGEAIILRENGTMIISGITDSNNGDVSQPIPGKKVWLIKLDEFGELIWDMTFGGSDADYCYSLINTPDGGLAFAGFTWSTDGDLAGLNHHGLTDFWIVKLAPETTGVQEAEENAGLELFPNPACEYVQVRVPAHAGTGTFTLCNAQGRVALEQSISPEQIIDTDQLQPGLYFARFWEEGGRFWSTKLLIGK
ncbi:MAG: T9SS type A sorting domain-containing protein [Saprospiraceae bacterium]|nr:T9SS type A sorting domain-containing protein [Saprospiraceae bacterium]